MVGYQDDLVSRFIIYLSLNLIVDFIRASMYFQSDHDEIINSLFKCDWPTGKFINQGTWLISADTPSVSNSTGLASLVLGSEAGYRVYFHDEDRAINELGYTPEGGWRYRELISPDLPTSSAIHAAFSGKNNISVVFPRDAENVEVDRYNSDETWHISNLPPILHPPTPAKFQQQPSLAT